MQMPMTPEESQWFREQLTQFSMRLSAVETNVASVVAKVDILSKQQDMPMTLIKYVITPLVIGICALVGIKLVIP